MTEIEKLKEEEKQLKSLLEANREKQRNYYVDEFCKKYNVELGKPVQFHNGKEIIFGVLDHFEFSYDNKVNYPMVKPFIGKGKVGKISKRCWFDNLETLKKVDIF